MRARASPEHTQPAPSSSFDTAGATATLKSADPLDLGTVAGTALATMRRSAD